MAARAAAASPAWEGEAGSEHEAIERMKDAYGILQSDHTFHVTWMEAPV